MFKDVFGRTCDIDVSKITSFIKYNNPFDCLSFSVMQICPASWENDWFWAFWALTRKAGVRLRLR